jgi:hypothetical protein
MERLSYVAENAMNRAWAEFFGLLRLVVVLPVTLIGQSLRFIGWAAKRGVLMPLVVIGDQVFRPALWVIYASYLYPMFVFLLAVLHSLLVLATTTIASLATPAIAIIQAFRLVEITNRYDGSSAQGHSSDSVPASRNPHSAAGTDDADADATTATPAAAKAPVIV